MYSSLCEEMKVGGKKKTIKTLLYSSELIFTPGTNIRIQDCIWDKSLIKWFFKATDRTQTTASSLRI